MNIKTQYLLEDVINQIIADNNPGECNDTLERLCEDVDQIEEAMEQIREYLDQ